MIIVVTALSCLLARSCCNDTHHYAGNYGNWSADTLGLPVYEYTFNQVVEGPPHPPSQTKPWDKVYWGALPLSYDTTARASSEHVFQLGNDR
jgi:hypothetical protein